MGYSFLEFMKRIGIFIICAQSFMHFAAGKSYEKYIKLLIGVMILAQFMVPVRAVFLKDEKAEIWDEVERFQAEMERTLAGAEIVYEEEDETARLLEAEISEKLKEAAEEYGYGIDNVSICEEPPQIYVAVTGKRTNADEIKVDHIRIESDEKKENVKTADSSIGNSAIENENGQNTAVIEKMKQRFGIVLGIDESYIEVQIR